MFAVFVLYFRSRVPVRTIIPCHEPIIVKIEICIGICHMRVQCIGQTQMTETSKLLNCVLCHDRQFDLTLDVLWGEARIISCTWDLIGHFSMDCAWQCTFIYTRDIVPSVSLTLLKRLYAWMFVLHALISMIWSLLALQLLDRSFHSIHLPSGFIKAMPCFTGEEW